MTKDISKEIKKINEKYNIDLLSIFSKNKIDCVRECWYYCYCEARCEFD